MGGAHYRRPTSRYSSPASRHGLQASPALVARGECHEPRRVSGMLAGALNLDAPGGPSWTWQGRKAGVDRARRFEIQGLKF